MDAGDYIPEPPRCYFVRGEEGRVPLFYNDSTLYALMNAAMVRNDYVDAMPTHGSREMLQGIPL